MKQILLMIAVVALVGGCGESAEVKAAKVKAAAEARAVAEAKAAAEAEKAAKVIETEIRKELKKPEGELTEADLEKVTYLRLYNNKLTEVPKELEKLTRLKHLQLIRNHLTDVKGLEKLTQLTKLALDGNRLTSVKGLEKLTQLEVLALSSNKLRDVKGLENLTQLTGLVLGDNRLTDVTGLEKLTRLEYLDLRFNPALSKAQIDELQKALPKCAILSSPKR